jgi:hypothetical protein
MKRAAVARWSAAFLFATCVTVAERSLSQTSLIDLSSPHTQADYVIITPLRYVPTMQPLAAFRQARNGFAVAIITTEAIYNIFGQGVSPDSAIRSFITFTLTGGWRNPAPQFFLLAGNVDAVPSHKEPGMILPPSIYEDSVHIDQWLVEGIFDTTFPRPAAAIGRFPAQDSAALATMVAKTIAYESSADSSWFGRTLIAADYDDEAGYLFEQIAQIMQQRLVPIWWDTLTAHVRQSSPLHRTRQQFRNLWNQGAAIVSLFGLANRIQFSRSAYFTSRDVDSLADYSPLVFFTMESDQRFERTDTLAIVARLLEARHKGAVATLAPTGLMYANINFSFFEAVFQRMASYPNRPIGKVVLDVKRSLFEPLYIRRQTLLGDPALVVKNPRLTGIVGLPPGVPDRFLLHQNYPNPFNSTTTIAMSVPRRSVVSLKVFDVLGREVETLFTGELPAGVFRWRWNPQNAASGMYFYRMQADGYVETKRMLLMK